MTVVAAPAHPTVAGTNGVRWRRDLLVLAPLLLAAAYVHATGSATAPAYADDEGTYVAQAFALRHWHTLAHYTYWYDHPPLGWMQVAGWQALTAPVQHVSAIAAARQLMVVLSVVDVALLYVLARRLSVARPWALLAAGLWAFSPLAVSTSRQVLLDGLGLPWALGALVLAASPRRSIWAHTGAGLCLALATLSKETWLLLAPAVVWLVWQHSHRHTRSFSLAGLASGLLVAGGYPLYATLKGELVPGPGHVSLLDALRFQLWTRPSNGAVLTPGTPAHAIVLGWWRSDPWLLGLVVAAVPALLVHRVRPLAATLVVLAAAPLRPGYLPPPYVIALLPLAALCLAGVLDAVSHPHERGSRARLGRACGVAVAALLVVEAAPAWASADRSLMTRSEVRPVVAAERWLVQHADRRQRVLVDDTMWADLVAHGFRRDRVIWLYKLDFVNNLDPSVARYVKRAHDLGYLVVSPIVRTTLATSDPSSYAVVRRALVDSQPVASFGTGDAQIVIRKVRR